ncbi:uncharacterized protein [Ambystoma mexicanum]|uniref:uncharacterized protein n=1 Tax=Ambystoma mexicanum TaxID=8296 RepID=UPI0037E8470E
MSWCTVYPVLPASVRYMEATYMQASQGAGRTQPIANIPRAPEHSSPACEQHFFEKCLTLMRSQQMVGILKSLIKEVTPVPHSTPVQPQALLQVPPPVQPPAPLEGLPPTPVQVPLQSLPGQIQYHKEYQRFCHNLSQQLDAMRPGSEPAAGTHQQGPNQGVQVLQTQSRFHDRLAGLAEYFGLLRPPQEQLEVEVLAEVLAIRSSTRSGIPLQKDVEALDKKSWTKPCNTQPTYKKLDTTYRQAEWVTPFCCPISCTHQLAALAMYSKPQAFTASSTMMSLLAKEERALEAFGKKVYLNAGLHCRQANVDALLTATK